VNKIRIRDLAERVMWTAISAGASSLIGVAFGITALQAAGIAALTAAINAVTVIARWRLSVLPNPGEGLPGLPTHDALKATP
jgi:heme/copper-type cytochrome/quinol oxidase subunit 1